MTKKLYFDTEEEFELSMENKNLEISNAIVEVALDNLTTKRRYIPCLEIHILEEEKIYDVTLDRKDIIETLESNLIIQEYYENYETCFFIKEANLNIKLI